MNRRPDNEAAHGVTDLNRLIACMDPVLNDGDYVFTTVPNTGSHNIEAIPREITVCEIKEKEGVTFVLLKEHAERLGLSFDFVASWITLNIHSALEAVGLTAAFSNALSDQGISCNVIAGFHHDHIFVSKQDAEKAIQALILLAQSHAKK